MDLANNDDTIVLQVDVQGVKYGEAQITSNGTANSVLVCTLSSLKMGCNRAVVVHLKAFLNQSVQGHRPVQPIQKL